MRRCGGLTTSWCPAARLNLLSRAGCPVTLRSIPLGQAAATTLTTTTTSSTSYRLPPLLPLLYQPSSARSLKISSPLRAEEEASTKDIQGSRWAPVLTLPVESFAQGEETTTVGTVQLNPNLFKVELRKDILHRVVVWQLAKRRQGTHKTKSRAEVRGGGRKPRPQKGSGRSRQGSIRSPLWKGGGNAHPRRPRDYYYPLPVKVKRLGLKMALSLKYAQGKLRIIKNTQIEEGKTKLLIGKIKAQGWFEKKTLLIDGRYVNELFRRASNNIHWLKVLPQRGCNVYDILNHEQLVLTLEAVQYLEGRLVDASAPQFYEFGSKKDGSLLNSSIRPPVANVREFASPVRVALEAARRQRQSQKEIQVEHQDKEQAATL